MRWRSRYWKAAALPRTDFSVLHPGGKLGAMLKFVRDLMHTGGEVPLKPLGTKMSDALVEMSSKGFGCVGIVDASGDLVGIITDGDLRRHMRPDLMTAAVDEVMTKNPKTTTPDTLAIELLDTLNSSQPRDHRADRGRGQEAGRDRARA